MLCIFRMHRIRACYLPALLLTMLLLQVFAAPLDEVLLPAHFKYPNGIAHQQDGTVFVGSVTEGKILRIDKDGNIATFFADNAELNSVTAIRYDQHHHSLWVASPDFAGPRQGKQSTPRAHRLGFINVASGKLRWVVDMPDNGFGNDFAIDDIYFGTQSTIPPTTVPEPLTLSLLAIGLLGIGFSRRKKA